MPTIATFAKAITEALVIIGVLVPFAKWVITKLLAQQDKALAAFREELKLERDGHEEEVDKMLVKYEHLKDSNHFEHEKTRNHVSVTFKSKP